MPNGNPNNNNVFRASGTDRTLIRGGIRWVRVCGSKILKSGPHNSAKKSPGTAFHPKYTTHKTRAACGR